jgi:O-antigen/teichoic acid export membrane protein
VSNPLKKLAGQTVVYGLGTMFPRFINYFITPILTYNFLPQEFAINSVLFTYISFLNVVFSYGMETAFFNFYNRREDKAQVLNTALVSLVISSLSLGLLLYLLAPSLTHLLSTPNATYQPEFVNWSILILVSEALCIIPFASLRAENKSIRFSLLKLMNVLVNTSIILFYVFVCKPAYESGNESVFANWYRPEIGIGYVFLAGLIANLTTLLSLGSFFKRITFTIDKALLKDMLSYGWPILVLGIGGMINDTFDRIFITWLIEDKAQAQVAQGIYGACYKIAILMTIFTTAFRFAVEPFFFNRAKDKNSKKLNAIVMKYYVIFCSFLFLITVVNINWIQYLIDKPYREGIFVVPILLIAYLFLGIVYNLSIWYKITQQTRFGIIITFSGAVVTLLVNAIFVSKYSYAACAWATLGAFSVMMVVSYVLGQKYYPIKYNLRAMSVYFVLAFLLYMCSWLFEGIANSWIRIIANNMLVGFYLWLVYKLEWKNLKNIEI